MLRPRRQPNGRPRVSRLVIGTAIAALAVSVLAPSTALGSGAPVARPTAGSSAITAAVSPKLRGGLRGLVAGTTALDARVPALVPGYRPGELAVFAVLTAAADASHRAALTAAGARILRSYRSVDLVALAALPAAIEAVAALSWVAWLAPVEVVVPLAANEATTSVAVGGDAPALPDQTRTTAGDLSARPPCGVPGSPAEA